MARIEGIFWDVETGVPIFNSSVELRSVDGKEVLKTVATDANGKFVIDDVEPGEYMVVGKSFVHHPVKLLLVGEDSLEEPGIEIRLESTPAIL